MILYIKIISTPFTLIERYRKKKYCERNIKREGDNWFHTSATMRNHINEYSTGKENIFISMPKNNENETRVNFSKRGGNQKKNKQ